MANEERPEIPRPMKRAIRQRCGFGCVICGSPVYEYDHMKEWSVVKEHKVEDITLLCDKHHKEVTTGLLPRSKVFEANENPFNIVHNQSSPYHLHFSGENCNFIIGNVKVNSRLDNDTTFAAIAVDGQVLVGFRRTDGEIYLYTYLCDEYNIPILNILENELLICTDLWDIEFVGTNLILRQASRNILLDITFAPPDQIYINRGRLLLNGVEIIINKDGINVGGQHSFTGGEYNSTTVGIYVGRDYQKVRSAYSIGKFNRYNKNDNTGMAWNIGCKFSN